ncbi:MAG: TolC family protein [Kiritimatiellae bacterium]|nr:TolC family protein [Kiritimatiellia bacterium]
MPARIAISILVALAAAPAGALDLESAVAAALKSDPRVLGARALLAAAQGERRAAWAPRDPEARFEYSESEGTRGTTLPGAEQWDEYSYGLRFFPSHPGVARAGSRAAAARVRAAEAAVRLAGWQTSCEVRRLFCDVARLREQVAAEERCIAATRVRHAVAREKAEGGAATSLDVSAAALDVLDAVRRRDRTSGLLFEASARLAALAGRPDLSDVELSDSFTPPDIDPAGLDVERLVGAALEQREDVASAAWQMAAAEADLAAERRGRQPWLTHIEVSYSEERGYQDDETWGVGAGFGLPLFSSVAPGAQAAREGDVACRREELVAARELARQEITEAVGALRAAAQRRRAFEAEAGPVLREMKDTLSGLAGRDDVGDDMRAALEEKIALAEADLIEARHAHELAWLWLEEVLGTSPQDALSRQP